MQPYDTVSDPSINSESQFCDLIFHHEEAFHEQITQTTENGFEEKAETFRAGNTAGIHCERQNCHSCRSLTQLSQSYSKPFYPFGISH
jgi:hypothetical protein